MATTPVQPSETDRGYSCDCRISEAAWMPGRPPRPRWPTTNWASWASLPHSCLVTSFYRMSHRSAGRFMPMPTAFACADHCSVVSPAGPASRKMAYIVSWFLLSFASFRARCGKVVGKTISDVIGSPSGSVPRSMGSRTEAISAPSPKSLAHSTVVSAL
jgi:hypothetical protein